MTEYEFIEDISKNLIKLMNDRGISQSKLAKESDVDRSLLNKYINGVSIPSLKNIANICLVLDCQIDDIVTIFELIE